MGLDQQILRVKDIDLNKFYALKGSAIIAPHNPDLDQDYINTTAQKCKELEELYTKALSEDDPDANVYRERIDELLVPYDERTIWYGRKENHIHQWVINSNSHENIGHTNLDYVLIDPNALLSDLKTVLDNHDLAPKILPTQSGFFFGDTEYSDYYFEDVEHLYEVLLAEKEDGYFDSCSYFYWSWW